MRASVQENRPLSPLTTFGIGGPARYFIEAASESDVCDALDFADTNRIPVFVLGSGSNLLVADDGFPGLVLKIGIMGAVFGPSGSDEVVLAGAGEDWDGIVASAVHRGFAGVECLSGIPGSVGGTPIQNVGAYGQETADVLTSVSAFDRVNQRIVDLSHDDCGFSYRASMFNTTEKNRYIVLGVAYALQKDGEPTLTYPELRRQFESSDVPPTLQDVRQTVLEIRAGKGMLWIAGDPDCRSAGSFFKNPVVTEDIYRGLQESVAETVPKYPAGAGRVKLSAAWLIERAGLAKGFAIGPAALSGKHVLAVVNTGGASAADIVRLAREVRTRVEGRFGIRLVPEPVFVGFDERF